jgi:hypothetical protein
MHPRPQSDSHSLELLDLNQDVLGHFRSLPGGSELVRTKLSASFRASIGKSVIPENLFDELTTAIFDDTNTDTAANTLRKKISALVKDVPDLIHLISAAAQYFQINFAQLQLAGKSQEFLLIVFGALQRESRGWLRQQFAEGIARVAQGSPNRPEKFQLKNSPNLSISPYLDTPNAGLGFTFFINALGKKVPQGTPSDIRDDALPNLLSYVFRPRWNSIEAT